MLTQRYSAQQQSKVKPESEMAAAVAAAAADPPPPPSPADGTTGDATGSTTKRTKVVKKPPAVSMGKLNLPPPQVPTTRYTDLGGMESVLEEIKDLVERPFRNPEVYQHLGVDPPRGILLHGAPGSGKTSLAMAIAGELQIPLIKVSAPELVSGMSGESEGRIRDLFEQARASTPCLLFLDEIDAITPKRETAQREMERRIVAQLITCMDDLSRSNSQLMVIGATNRPESLDPALRRAGRFDRELQLGIPNEAARLRILQVVCARMRLDESVKDHSHFLFLQEIARNTPGYVGADLKALAQEAANVAIRRIFDLGIPLEDPLASITPDDFTRAMEKIQPSATREGFAVVPDTRWEDIGALQYVRDELRMAVVEPIRHAEKFEAVGITAPAGVLLWGPPGCGKTLLAKAVANESHSNFISVKGPELLNKYVGESERAVRQVFERARHSAPCVVFFDELDALCPRRSDESDSATSRVVNQLLTEMDGLEGRRQVFILAATNRPDIIDPAMTRPGRLDKLLYVNLPSPSERAEILCAIGRRTPWAAEVDLAAVALDPRCDRFSGADLAALVREAAMAAVRESIESDNLHASKSALSTHMQLDPSTLIVSPAHIEAAFARVSPSVSPLDLASYEALHRLRRDGSR